MPPVRRHSLENFLPSRKGKPFRTGERRAALFELFDTFAAKPFARSIFPWHLCRVLNLVITYLTNQPETFRGKGRNFCVRTESGSDRIRRNLKKPSGTS